MVRPSRTRLLVSLAVLGLPATLLVPAGPAAAGAGVAPKAAAAAAKAPAADRTSALEAKRVDSVPTPKLGWYTCFGYAQCATVKLPLDYDQPKGAKTEIAVLRVKARDQKRKIGTLFVNPGGPGGSAAELAYAAPYFLSDKVLDRFDVVGVDPRGIGFSENLRCFRNQGEQADALKGWQVPFPYGATQEKAYVASAKALGRACSTTGKPLSGAMSTAEVARDMDVMRRAVGDKKLTYLGFSYGTALGQYYANLFPDRTRALAIDGVINPQTWVGTTKTAGIIQDDRLRSADGAYKALREILVRCDRAGGKACAFAGGNPVANFDLVARRLRAAPAELGDGYTVTYAEFVSSVLGALYDDSGYRSIADLAQQLLVVTEPPAPAAAARAGQRQRQAVARSAVVRHLAAHPTSVPRRGFPYDNGWETYSGVACTDGLHPADASLWPKQLAASDRRAPYFGRAWGYATIACGRSTWTVRDEDAYTGPFTKRTSGPVLVVGNYWDPATNYADAVTASTLLPNSRLLSSDSWGHTAYGRTACVTSRVDTFLLTVALPKAGTVCVGDVQPFAAPTGEARTLRTARPLAELDRNGTYRAPAPGSRKYLPPVAAPAKPALR